MALLEFMTRMRAVLKQIFFLLLTLTYEETDCA